MPDEGVSSQTARRPFRAGGLFFAFLRTALLFGMPNTRKPKPVGVDELQRAILRTIVREFDGRPLDRDTATQALALAAFELNMVAIRAVAAAAPTKPRKRLNP
jgi:hypothetical protein